MLLNLIFNWCIIKIRKEGGIMSENISKQASISTPKFENTTVDAQRKRRRRHHLPHGAKVAIVIVSLILTIAILYCACYLAGLTFFGVVIALVIVSAMPENDGTFEYQIYDGTIEIVGLVDENSPGPLYIPEYIEGIPVTSIGSSAFEETNIMEVYIPDTVTYISSYAFYECKNLTKVDMGNGVEIVSSNAFRYCTSLTEVEMSSNLNDIGYGSFSECSSLEHITIPQRVEYISTEAFENTPLKKVIFEDTYGWMLVHEEVHFNSDELSIPEKAAELLTIYSLEAWQKME